MNHKLMGRDVPCTYDHELQISCNICDGGLALCVTCGGAEGSLPTDCPGVRMTEGQQDQVFRGDLDYREGMWRGP